MAAPRCLKCKMVERLCLCALIPRLETATKVVVILHAAEDPKTTNTGRLATRALTNSKLFIHGQKGAPLDLEGTLSRDGNTYLLFPDENAPMLSAEFVAAHKNPITLVVPDGNWSQARKMCRTIPQLAALPRVRIPYGRGSLYRIRRAPHACVVCTIEAIARALGILETTRNGSAVQRALEQLLDEMVSRVMTAHRTPRKQRRVGPSEQIGEKE
jgi:DTW domain-containing protein YfiP